MISEQTQKSPKPSTVLTKSHSGLDLINIQGKMFLESQLSLMDLQIDDKVRDTNTDIPSHTDSDEQNITNNTFTNENNNKNNLKEDEDNYDISSEYFSFTNDNSLGRTKRWTKDLPEDEDEEEQFNCKGNYSRKPHTEDKQRMFARLNHCEPEHLDEIMVRIASEEQVKVNQNNEYNYVLSKQCCEHVYEIFEIPEKTEVQDKTEPVQLQTAMNASMSSFVLA